jgi:hypothetical protein
MALAAAVLIIVMLLKMGAFTPPAQEEHKALTVQLLPPELAPAKARAVAKKKRASSAASRPAPSHTPAVTTAAPTHAPPTPPWNVTPLTQQQFAAADIANKPARSDTGSGGAGTAAGAGDGKDSSAVYGPGDGPGGEQMFNAEWYRRPSHAEMAFYLPPGGAPVGWGMIACKTAERYHVEDCRELGESPGSGLAKALRQAAWQFLVRPPRSGGRPLIGAWVRIRFDFTQDGPDKSGSSEGG